MNPTIPTPLERAAKAAYTRPDGSIPWERRKPRTRAYWRSVAARAIGAMFDRIEVAVVLDDHRPLPPVIGGEHWRCAACHTDLGPGDSDRGVEIASLRHRADALRAHFLTPIYGVRVVPPNDPGRVYGHGYDDSWFDDLTEAEHRAAINDGRMHPQDPHQ
ncbi:hypothetical protein GCM10028784_07160 [Myceligenerans cantabricum]